MTGRQLGELLGLPPQSLMHHVVCYPDMRREKHRGVYVNEKYGVPKELVYHTGRGIAAAVEEVFTGVPDYICHFHFLH